MSLFLRQVQDVGGILNCKLGKLPLKYLGMWLHNGKLPKELWRSFISRIEARLPRWRGKFLSLGGRLVLLNSVLSSIPIYFMSFYKFPGWVVKQIDKIRRNFLWKGAEYSITKKHSLIAWGSVCLRKDMEVWG